MSVNLGARHFEGKLVSLEGRTIRGAVNPLQGFTNTLQAIPGNLILGNLGLSAKATPVQGAALLFVLVVLWAGMRRRPAATADPPRKAVFPSFPASAFNPLECAGATVVLGSYLMEWSFRGYVNFDYWRTVDIRAMVPWYDAIPQVGAVLFAAGWWSGARRLDPQSSLPHATSWHYEAGRRGTRCVARRLDRAQPTAGRRIGQKEHAPAAPLGSEAFSDSVAANDEGRRDTRATG